MGCLSLRGRSKNQLSQQPSGNIGDTLFTTIFFLIFRSGSNPQILLKCDNIPDLTYTTKIYTREEEEITEEKMETDSIDPPNGWTESNQLKNQSMILIMMTPPDMIDTEYKFTGIILYEKNSIFQTSLPEITFSVAKLNNNEYSIKHNDVINGDLNSFLCLLCCNVSSTVQIKLPEGLYRSLAGLIELDCYFTRIEVVSMGRFYFYDGNCEELKNCLVKLKGEEVDLFTR